MKFRGGDVTKNALNEDGVVAGSVAELTKSPSFATFKR